MATFSGNNTQYTGEKKTYTIDFTDNLASGVTVSAGTAIHTPPSGTAGTPTVQVSSPYLLVTVTNPAPAGNHYLDVIATLSDGDKPSVRVAINVVYPPAIAREGMTDLISQVRGMADAGINEYSVSGVPYWNDAQIQTLLDKFRTDVRREQLYTVAQYTTGGTVQYFEYRSRFKYLEQGTAYLYLQNNLYDTEGTAGYSVDVDKGIFTFTTDRKGSVYFLTARAYDIYAAAAELWRMKAGHAARMYSFSTDNHRFERGQYIANCLQMAEQYESYGGIGSGEVIRCDNVS